MSSEPTVRWAKNLTHSLIKSVTITLNGEPYETYRICSKCDKSYISFPEEKIGRDEINLCLSCRDKSSGSKG